MVMLVDSHTGQVFSFSRASFNLALLRLICWYFIHADCSADGGLGSTDQTFDGGSSLNFDLYE